MTVIIDTSALVAYLLEEDGFESIRGLLFDQVNSTSLLVKESFNALLEARKIGRIGSEEAEKILEVVLTLLGANIKIHPQEDLMRSAFNIATDHGITIYDSVYLALAKKLDGSLASRDKKQMEVARKVGIGIAPT